MHEAGAIDENVGAAEFLFHLARQRIDRLGRAHVERQHLRAREALELAGIEIGRDHGRAFGDEGFRNGAADALSGGGDDCNLAVQASAMRLIPVCSHDMSVEARLLPTVGVEIFGRKPTFERAPCAPAIRVSTIENQAVSRFLPFTTMC